MADQTRDVELNIAVQTTGEGQVVELAKQLDTLAKEGGAAAPEFERLAAELRKIGEQNAAVTALGQLQAEVEQTAKSFGEARTKAAELDGALTTQAEKTQALREQQVAARGALEQTAAQVRETKAALDLLKASSDESAKKTTAYKNEVVDLATQLARLKATQAEQRAALQSTNAELRQGEGDLRAAGKEYDAAATSVGNFGKKLNEQKGELDQARAAMTQSGVAATELSAAEAEVAQSMERTRSEIAQVIEAQQKAVASTRALAEAERQLHAEMQFEAETAQRVVAADNEQAAASERVAQAKREEAQAQHQAAAAAQQSAEQTARVAQEALNQAFSTIGARSIQQIEAELGQVRTALNTIRDSGQVAGGALSQAMNLADQRVAQLERELRAANGQLTLFDRAANALNTTVGQFAAGATFANVIQNAAYQVQQLGAEALTANVDLQKLELGLKAVYGSSAVAAKQIEFLRNTAQEAGVSVGDISGAYVKFAASAQSANIPVTTTNGLFVALTKNAATLGLSGDKVTDMLNALGQMASKGVVQMEELRGQLGDALPGALPKVAQGLGITTLEMEKLARNGELLASEVFPALQRVLEQSSGEVDTISAKWARFKNVMTETAQDIGKGAIGEALGGAFGAVGRVAEHLAFTVALIGEGFTTLGQQIGVAVSDIVDQGTKFRGFSDTAKKAFKDIDEEADTRMQHLAARIEGIAPVADKSFGAVGKAAKGSSQNITLVGDTIAYVGQQAQASSSGVQANAQAHAAAGAAAGQNAAAQAQAGAATAAGGGAAVAASGSWTQLSVSYSKINELLDQKVKLAKAADESTKAEGSATAELAQLTGNATTAANAAAVAASNNEKAQAALTQALDTQLNVLRAQRDAEIALYNASATKEEAQRKAIEELSKNIQLKAEELNKNREITESLKNEVTARQIASATLQDNSKRLYELRAAYQDAAAAAETLRAKRDTSKEGSDKLAEADRKAAAAARLYSDSLSDQINKLNETARAKQAKFSLDEAAIQLTIEEVRTAGEVARAHGDIKGALEADNTVKKLQIELLRLQADAQRAEAEAVLASLPAKRAQLELEGKLTEAMKKSLEAEELSAKAKIKQAEITDELANRIGRVKNATDEAAASASNSAGGFDSMAGAMDQASSSADRLGRSLGNVGRGSTRAGAGEAPVMGADGRPVDGFVNKTVMGMDSDAISTLRQKRDLGLLSTSDKAAAEAAYMAETATAASFSSANQAFISPGVTQQAQNRARDAKDILDHIRSLERAGSASSGAAAAPTSTAPGAPAPQGSTHTVKIEIGGATTNINTASFADASALTGLLTQLSNASQRAS